MTANQKLPVKGVVQKRLNIYNNSRQCNYQASKVSNIIALSQHQTNKLNIKTVSQ